MKRKRRQRDRRQIRLGPWLKAVRTKTHGGGFSIRFYEFRHGWWRGRSHGDTGLRMPRVAAVMTAQGQVAEVLVGIILRRRVHPWHVSAARREYREKLEVANALCGCYPREVLRVGVHLARLGHLGDLGPGSWLANWRHVCAELERLNPLQRRMYLDKMLGAGGDLLNTWNPR